MPAPIPLEAPVTMATFPARAFMVMTPVLLAVSGLPSPGARRRGVCSADLLAEEVGGAVPQPAGEGGVERLRVVAPGWLVLLVVGAGLPVRAGGGLGEPDHLVGAFLRGGHEGTADAAAVDASHEAVAAGGEAGRHGAGVERRRRQAPGVVAGVQLLSEQDVLEL